MRRQTRLHSRLSECKGSRGGSGCGEPIRFVLLDTGKAIPVNPGENAGGNVAAHQGADGRLVGHVITRDKPAAPGDYRFTPHFATCEALDRQGKPKKPKPEPDPVLFDMSGAES